MATYTGGHSFQKGDGDMVNDTIFDVIVKKMNAHRLWKIAGLAGAGIGLFLSAGWLFVDLLNGYNGYASLPAEEPYHEWISVLVAIAPQFLQWFSVFVLIAISTDGDRSNDQYKNLMWLVLLVSFLIDVGTDIYALSDAFNESVFGIAMSVIKSVIIYTILSDWLFTFCGGILLTFFLDMFWGASASRAVSQATGNNNRNNKNRGGRSGGGGNRQSNNNNRQSPPTGQPIRDIPNDLLRELGGVDMRRER